MIFRVTGIVFASLLAAAVIVAGVARAEDAPAANAGQEDLDQAIEAKLSAEKVDDLSTVVTLAEKALQRGLDETNTDFAKKLLASTLIQRAGLFCRPIFEHSPPDAQWPKLRIVALADLEKALTYDNTSPESHYMIGRLNALPGGDRKRAVEAANETIRLSADSPRARSKALTLRANLTEDPEKRLADYDEAVKLAPDDDEIIRSRALFYILQNKPDKALADLDAAIKIDATSVETYEARGIALTLLDKLDEALASFDKAIELAPTSAEAYLHRARVQALKGSAKDALTDVNLALKLQPTNPIVLLLRARIQHQLGNTQEAIGDVDSVLKDRPGLRPALELRAALAAESGEYREAIKSLEQLRKLAPKDEALLAQLGMLYSAAKKPRRAVEVFTDALAQQADFFPALRGRADAYLRIGKQTEALADYEAALKARPEDASLLNNLAWTLATSPDDKLRDSKRALDLATEAAKQSEYKEAYILSTLAAAYAEAGDFEKAIEWCTKALDAAAPELKDDVGKELDSYKEKKPWRELQNEPEAEDAAADEKPAGTNDAAGKSNSEAPDPGHQSEK